MNSRIWSNQKLFIFYQHEETSQVPAPSCMHPSMLSLRWYLDTHQPTHPTLEFQWKGKPDRNCTISTHSGPPYFPSSLLCTSMPFLAFWRYQDLHAGSHSVLAQPEVRKSTQIPSRAATSVPAPSALIHGDLSQILHELQLVNPQRIFFPFKVLSMLSLTTREISAVFSDLM